MQTNRDAFVQDIKNDILADLHRTTYQANPWKVPRVSYNPVPDPYLQNPHNDVIAESVKREILAEIEAQRVARIAETAGYGQVLSDQKLSRLIDQRYRTLEDVKNEIRKELQSIQKMETGGSTGNTDPYIREIAQAIALEARQQGVPFEQVMQTLNGKSSNGAGLRGRMSDVINTGQRKGFLYGIGTGVLIYLLLPYLRNNRHIMGFSSRNDEMSFEDRILTDDDNLDE